jgi:hypothetical protein
MIELTKDELRALAHATVNHYSFLKKQEGSLPPREARILKIARDIEIACYADTVSVDVVRP